MIELSLREVTKRFHRGGEIVCALDRVTLDVPAAQFCVVMGPSGSGKSTLLHLVAGIDAPTSGTVIVDGRDLAAMSDDERTLLRRRRIGFVFQFFNLLPTLSALENAALPLQLDGVRRAEAERRARDLLGDLGLGDRLDHRPHQLSGGQMQRVALARALVGDPALLLADEPTGNLDSRSGEEVLALLRETATVRGHTVLMVTHDERAASVGDRIVHLVDGRVGSDTTTARAAAAR
ncbi:MAG TPA: ABC transporter ATP-binding protein [Candidatus Limnocylindria bacterium]|nr:ABC transporter ATP-binding protein [Candidatus Limnocylindria bacterium]